MQKAITKFTNKDVYVIGDFNINLFDTGEEFLNMVSDSGLLPVIDRPTRVIQHSSTLIDNIFTNQIPQNLTSGIVIDDASDHMPIFCSVDSEKRTVCDKRIVSYHKTCPVNKKVIIATKTLV